MVDYLQHWRANSPVFTSAPDTTSLFFNDQLKQVAERFRTGFVQGLPVMAMGGATGSGKSTLLRWIYDSLDPTRYEVMMVVLFKTETNSGWLAPRLAAMLGVDSPDKQNYSSYLAAIGQRLDEIRQENRRLVLLIDACERIQHSAALEELSALVDVQLSGSATVSILLAGADEFHSGVMSSSSPGSAPLAGRVGWRDHLPALKASDGPGYVNRRLTEAGISGEIFTTEAADLAARLSNGNLHLLNSLCENALVDSAEASADQVTRESVQHAARFILETYVRSQAQAQAPIAPAQEKAAKAAPGQQPHQIPSRPPADKDADVPLKSLFKQKDGSNRKKSK